MCDFHIYRESCNWRISRYSYFYSCTWSTRVSTRRTRGKITGCGRHKVAKASRARGICRRGYLLTGVVKRSRGHDGSWWVARLVRMSPREFSTRPTANWSRISCERTPRANSVFCKQRNVNMATSTSWRSLPIDSDLCRSRAHVASILFGAFARDDQSLFRSMDLIGRRVELFSYSLAIS